jgi:sterol 3beta-glucosyltransferase
MRITILTLGTHGDVQPFVALGIRLQRSGHRVRLAARDSFQEFVTSHGLEFASLGKEPGRQEADSFLVALSSLARVAGSFVPGRKAPIWPDQLPWLNDLVERSWRACEDADAVVSGILFFWVQSFAERLNVPWFIGLLQPCTPTRAFPNLFLTAMFPSITNLGSSLNMLTHRVVERLFYAVSLRLINLARRDVLKMPPLPNAKPIAQFYNERAVVMCAYSPTLSPRPTDWPQSHQVTGYWFLENTNWNPPLELVEFLSSGPPPIYVGFGSFSDKDPDKLTSVVVKALERVRQRGVLLTGWGGLSRSDLPETIFPIASVPHDWLFPRMAAIVHHGGAGTTGSAIRAGIPAVSIPWRADHPFFANRAYAIGVSTRPIPKKKLTADRLTAALDLVLHDPHIRNCTSAAAREFGKEDGLLLATTLIEQGIGRKVGVRYP